MTPTPRCFMYDLLETINQANNLADADGVNIPVTMFASGDDMFIRTAIKGNGNRTYNIGRTTRIKIAEAIRYIKNDMMFGCTELVYDDFIDALTDAAAQV